MGSRGARGGGLLRATADLVAVAVVAVLTVVLSLRFPWVLPAPVRVALGFLFVFVLPGYAATAALYPSMYEVRSGGAGTGTWSVDESLAPREALVLTVGLSIAVVPLSVLAVNYTQLTIGPETTLGTVAVVTVAASLLAAVRRVRTPVTRTTGAPIGRLFATLADRVRSQATGGPSAAAVAVGLLVVSGGVAGAALVDTEQGETYTELSLLTTETESGNLTAGGYPTSLAPDDPTPLVVSVGNHEGERVRYTVVVRLQEVVGAGEQRAVRRATTLDRVSMTVADGAVEREQRPVAGDPAYSGTRHRLAFLLYRGEPPETPRLSNAYRQTHIWVTVTE